MANRGRRSKTSIHSRVRCCATRPLPSPALPTNLKAYEGRSYAAAAVSSLINPGHTPCQICMVDTHEVCSSCVRFEDSTVLSRLVCWAGWL
ncbi:hypothetical protein VFPPC_17521 [Pochonia chlamydosporia 170]|uniref:Uncharacterized protein n=1 Tax=Pochonia chlamydosporia 170 TaxID=1380566 RepID=A0A219ARC3_METCM|nr:hypothetical protein VFPPC_17521 [Pochonia chlamydosporia 170]OWT43316.1 hypothetical protein VFPPC_17521 [Pochonia chlamydosporia 170]